MKGLVVKAKQVSIQEDLPMPTPQTGEVLVKIAYSSVHSFDLENIAGKNDFLAKVMGVRNLPVKTGIEFSGTVETDGKHFKKGDDVFGYPDLTKGLKAHQEYITIHEDLIALMPVNLGFAESAVVPVGALTSLVAIEDLGKIQKGSKVLINGAAGGLGVYAVQLAKIFGAHITAVAGAGQEAFLQELGADVVINYKEQKLETINGSFDMLFDLTAKVHFATIKKLLSPKGVFVPANPFTQLIPVLGNAFRKKKVGYLLVDKGNRKNLTRIAQWIAQGKLKPIIDKTYQFHEYDQALKRTLEAGKRGRILLKVAQSIPQSED